MFAGSIEFNGQPIGQKLLIEAESPGGLFPCPSANYGYWQDATATLIQSHSGSNTADNIVACCADTGVRLLGWMRLDDTENLAKKLPEVRDRSAEQLVLSAYKYWGRDLAQHLLGDFALAIYDPRDRSCLLVRDHLGVRPLFYHQDQNRLIFASSLSVLQRLDPVFPLSVAKPWLCKYLYRGSADWEETAFEHIYKVPAAHSLQWAAGQISKTGYFSFNEEEPLIFKQDSDYVDAYGELLTEAVRCRISPNQKIATESSGGLDSSSIIVTASQVMQKPEQHLYCYGFAEFTDEPGKIMAVSHMANAHSTQIFSYRTWNSPLTPDPISQQFSQGLGAPFDFPGALTHYPIYQQAAEAGCQRLLSGFGGDDFVTSQSREALVELFQQKKYSLWLSRQKGSVPRKLARALKWRISQYTDAAVIGGTKPDLGLAARWQSHIFNTDACHKYDLWNHFQKNLDWPEYENSLNTMLLSRATNPIFSARLQDSTLAAALYGLEYCWPLLDIRLIRFFLRVPAEQRYGPGGMTRYLHRRAMAPYLPASIGPKTLASSRILPNRPVAKHPAVENFDELASPLQDIVDEDRFNKLKEQQPYALLWQKRLYQLNLWLKDLK